MNTPAFVVIRCTTTKPHLYRVFRRTEHQFVYDPADIGEPNGPVDIDTALERRAEFQRIAARRNLPLR